MEELMPHMDVAALAETDAKVLKQLSDQQELLGLMDEKLDSHHSEAMESQRRNHSEAMGVQRGIMERQSSNHSEAMASHQAMHSRLGELESKVIPLLEKLQARAATDEQLKDLIKESNQSELLEQLKVAIQQVETLTEQIETLKEQNGQTNEDVLKKLETIDASTDLWMTECREERYDEWLKHNLDGRLQDAYVTITELQKAKKELEEKVKAIAREDAEVVARQSAASKTTGGHTNNHKVKKSVRFRDVSNTQSRSKNYTKGIAPDCLKRADAKKEGTLSRREEIERSKAKNSLPSMRF